MFQFFEQRKKNSISEIAHCLLYHRFYWSVFNVSHENLFRFITIRVLYNVLKTCVLLNEHDSVCLVNKLFINIMCVESLRTDMWWSTHIGNKCSHICFKDMIGDYTEILIKIYGKFKWPEKPIFLRFNQLKLCILILFPFGKCWKPIRIPCLSVNFEQRAKGFGMSVILGTRKNEGRKVNKLYGTNTMSVNKRFENCRIKQNWKTQKKQQQSFHSFISVIRFIFSLFSI